MGGADAGAVAALQVRGHIEKAEAMQHGGAARARVALFLSLR